MLQRTYRWMSQEKNQCERPEHRTRVIPRAAICLARTSGSLLSGDPSSNPGRRRIEIRRPFPTSKKKEHTHAPSPYSPIPWGGASAMSTIILLACSLHSILSASARPAVTASGPSPPPEAYKLERSRCTLSMSDEKPKLRVT